MHQNAPSAGAAETVVASPVRQSERRFALKSRPDPAAVHDYVSDLVDGSSDPLALQGVARFGTVADFLRLKAEQNTAMRDNARAHHGKFGKKDLNQLRNSFLTSSLDTTSLSRDIDEYIHHEGRFSTAHFFRSLEPWQAQRELVEGVAPEPPMNLLTEIMDEQSKKAKELVEFDQDYRDILSTVASLGSSIYAFRVQKYAIAIAVISIFIAVIALLSEEARAALGAKLWSWLLAIWPWD
jgi:hypothetical protein